MITTKESRIIVGEPQRVSVKYAGGEKEMKFDNEVTEVIVTDQAHDS